MEVTREYARSQVYASVIAASFARFSLWLNDYLVMVGATEHVTEHVQRENCDLWIGGLGGALLNLSFENPILHTTLITFSRLPSESLLFLPSLLLLQLIPSHAYRVTITSCFFIASFFPSSLGSPRLAIFWRILAPSPHHCHHRNLLLLRVLVRGIM